MLVISVPTTPGTRLALRQAVGDHHVEQLVAVVEAAGGVDHLQPVGIAVEGDAVVGAVLGAPPRPAPAGAVAPKPSLMLKPSGWQPIADDLGAELVEDVGRDVVGRAVGGVDDDLQALAATGRC